MFKMLTLMCLINSVLAVSSQLETPTAEHRSSESFDKSTFDQKLQIINRLGKNRQFDELTRILKQKTIWSEFAAVAICKNLEIEKLKEFCNKQKTGTSTWRVAIDILSSRNGEEFIPFILTNIGKMSLRDRAYLYEIFAIRGWPELVEFAIEDSDSNEQITGRNLPLRTGRVTVGMIATRYVQKLDN